MAALRAISVLSLWLVSAVAGAADWPREVRSGDATIVLYQPQIDSLDGIDAKARIAVAIKRPGRPPEFGAVWVATTLDVDRDQDTARIQSLVIERARFPDATEQEVKNLTALIERAAPKWDLDFSLAELRAGLEAENGTGDPAFRNDPPRVIYRDRSAILVTLDGQPRLQAIHDTPYQRVINTPFPIVLDPATGEYWLFGSRVWFTTRELLRGRWTARDSAPEGIARLFAGPDKQASTDPGDGVPTEQLRQAEIIVTTEPAELISTDGEPQYRPLVGDEMLYVTNTGSDLFLEVPTKLYYVVLSGRWYQSRSLAGPWTYVAPAQVPKAFADVPRKSDKAEVLAHVAGTDEAKDAIMDAMIPQTSAVRRQGTMLEIAYDGTPQFEQIPGTGLLYARNTAAQVLKVKDRYYAVDQGIWYVANSAYGPWAVAESRPEEVEQIPPSSPAYNVKYVYIYDYTPDIVYVGYLPGYTWAFPYRGAIVYGTGYNYGPWLGPVFYYPRPRTWGFHMRYNPWLGWGYGMSWSAGWSSFSYGWGGGWGGYYTGFWADQHTGGWFGPGGYRPPPPHYRPEPRRDFRPPDRTQIGSLPGIGGRPSARSRPPSNIYAQPDARTDDRPDPRGSRRDVQPVRRPNNVYVDREGVPHRLTGEGWQTRENRRWRPSPELQRPVLTPTSPPAYRPSPPIELGRQVPPPKSGARDHPPEPGARPPPSGGWGNRAVPRDGPSLPSSRESRKRSNDLERPDRRQMHER